MLVNLRVGVRQSNCYAEKAEICFVCSHTVSSSCPQVLTHYLAKLPPSQKQWTGEEEERIIQLRKEGHQWHDIQTFPWRGPHSGI